MSSSAADLALVVLETIFLVYGICESKLGVFIRATVETLARGGFFSGFIFCPFCVGTWVSLGLGWLHGLEPVYLGTLVFIAVLAAKRDLIQPSSAELEAMRRVSS